MTRAMRLMDLADRLRGEAGVSVGHLADELGVSERTVMRDLAALRERGLPISGQAGPGGGVRLEGERGLTAVHLSLSEVMALWMAARLAREASVLPWSDAATTALHKLLASLPNARAAPLRALLRRVFVGKPASATLAQSAGATPPELLTLFEAAFTGGNGLGFRYTDAQRRCTDREIEPHGLLVEPPVWYILARDVQKDALRTFRMDRISSPVLLPDVRFRPSLKAALQQLPDELHIVCADTGRRVKHGPATGSGWT